MKKRQQGMKPMSTRERSSTREPCADDNEHPLFCRITGIWNKYPEAVTQYLNGALYRQQEDAERATGNIGNVQEIWAEIDGEVIRFESIASFGKRIGAVAKSISNVKHQAKVKGYTKARIFGILFWWKALA